MAAFVASAATLLLSLIVGFAFDDLRPVASEAIGGIAAFICLDLIFLSRFWRRSKWQVVRGVLQALLVLFFLGAPPLRMPATYFLDIAALLAVVRFVAATLALPERWW